MVSTNIRSVDCDIVCDLRRQARRWDKTTTPLSLWLVPTVPAMDQSIERIQEVVGALVFRRLAPGRDWKLMDDGALLSVIAFAVDELAVSALVICGNSACSGIWGEPCDTPHPGECSGYQRLLRGVQRRQERLNLQRQQVVDLLQELTDSPLIWKAIRLGRVSVHGMFYLAESSLFTIYDPLFGRLLPLDLIWATACRGVYHESC